MPEHTFDEHLAATYETKWPELFEPAVVEPPVDFLAGLAGAGSALEFGVGTGRIAVPLRARGVRVHGIDISAAMAARVPPEADVALTIGDFATTRVAGSFALVYLLRNTITNLTTQDEQVDCFRNAAAHLAPGGSFVVEVYVPELRRLPPGETVHPFTVTPRHLGFEEYDVAAQLAHSHHYWIADGRVETYSSPHRYVWPAELDLMARLAGLSLRERWAGWTREPFTGESRGHVSVWHKEGLTRRTHA